MARTIPSLQDIYNKIKSGIFSSTKGKLDPEADLFTQSLVTVFSQLINSAYKSVFDNINQTFSQLATDEDYLLAIAFDKTNNEVRYKNAERASGEVVVIATDVTTIPVGSQFITDDGEIYESTIERTCQLQQFTVESLVRVSNYIVATLTNHNLPTGIIIHTTGVNESGFNGSNEIEVISSSQFRWPNTGANTTATGSIIMSYFGSKVQITSVSASKDANKTYTQSIDVVDSIDFVESAHITFNGITGGTNNEDLLTEFKPRLVEYLRTPKNKGNIRQHQSWVTQNTDANYSQFYRYEDNFYIYVVAVVSKLSESFYFSNFTNDELTEMKNKFISQNQLLLGVSGNNLSFINPTFVNINITVNGLTPNTLDMRSAVELILREYIAKLPIKANMSSSNIELSSDKIKSIIKLARDQSGNTPDLTSLSISGVSGLDSNNKKAILGTLTYA